MQKIDFTHVFFKILQRNSKLVILGNLDMLGPTHTLKVSEETVSGYMELIVK